MRILIISQCCTSAHAKVPRLGWHELSRGNEEGLVRRVGRKTINLDQNTGRNLANCPTPFPSHPVSVHHFMDLSMYEGHITLFE